jgi:hypothetical protein
MRAQTADPFIAARMGACQHARLPRHGLYVVFEELPLGNYGNRLPQLSFEVFRPLADPDTAEGLTQCGHDDPGLGRVHLRDAGHPQGQTAGRTVPENLNALARTPPTWLWRWTACRRWRLKVESVSLVVAWFGERPVGWRVHQVRPGVEVSAKVHDARQHGAVNGASRSSRPFWSAAMMRIVRFTVARPADFAVVQAIKEMKARVECG